jgi:hypothetical protein
MPETLDYAVSEGPSRVPELCRQCPASPKIAGRWRAEKRISQDGAKQTVNCQLGQRVEDAQDHVEGNPGESKPARPIAAAEHTSSTQNRYEIDEFHPYDVGNGCCTLNPMR